MKPFLHVSQYLDDVRSQKSPKHWGTTLHFLGGKAKAGFSILVKASKGYSVYNIIYGYIMYIHNICIHVYMYMCVCICMYVIYKT